MRVTHHFFMNFYSDVCAHFSGVVFLFSGPSSVIRNLDEFHATLDIIGRQKNELIDVAGKLANRYADQASLYPRIPTTSNARYFRSISNLL